MDGVAADELGPFVGVGEHRAAVAVAAERLGREEARGGDVAERAGHLSVDRPAEALRSVLEQEHAVPLAHFPDRRIVGGKTEEVDGHDDPGCEIRLVLDEPHSFFEFGGVEVEGSFVHIDETGVAPSRAGASPLAKKVKSGTNTASPGPTPHAMSASCKASVPLAHVTQCLTPT